MNSSSINVTKAQRSKVIKEKFKFFNEKVNDPNGYTVADAWESTCDKFPNNFALHYVGCELFPKRSLTFRQTENYANQIAHFSREIGLKKGDCVALFMESRLEFFMTWLGLSKMGIKVALINSTIKHDPLVHSIAIAEAKVVIFGIELSNIIEAVYSQLIRKHSIEVICSGGNTTFCQSLDARVSLQPVSRPPRSVREGIAFSDIFGYIYTSGTTGLPKAVKMQHHKMWMYGLESCAYLTEKDVAYTSGMPLYHSAAGGIGTSMMYLNGSSLVIRRKFSAKQWMKDIRTYKVTIFQYIGEICRYIMSQPERPDDSDNTIIHATGNGLRPEYWVKFQKRFGIQRISEFYGSTEGNGSMRNNVYLSDIENGNMDGVGCIGNINRGKSGLKVVKYDIEKGDVVRDPKTNKVVECEIGEPGEGIFPITKNPLTAFTGYTSKKASKQKVLSDCYEKGDTYIRTGDLMSIDEKGWIRFVDRIGDTFRWKGENVSTNEVATELSKYPGLQEVNVYGVQIPNNLDGRAGMAAIVMKDISRENLQGLLNHARENLPSYAVPQFLRILPKIHVTATFKHQKVKLRKEGIDLKLVSDPLFWLDPISKDYKPFGEKEYAIATTQNSKL